MFGLVVGGGVMSDCVEMEGSARPPAELGRD